jgi:hypothetical protein
MRGGTRPIELFAVLILGVATVASAFCGYQAARWNGEETELGRQASNERVEASRLFGIATQRVSYDAVLVSQYAQAVALEEENLRDFYRAVLFRPEFLPVLDRWEAKVLAADVPEGGLLNDAAYIDAEFAEYRAATTAAEATQVEAEQAGRTADDFILTTLLLAAALFFAGVTTQFQMRLAQVLLLGGAGVTLAYSAARLADLPTI